MNLYIATVTTGLLLENNKDMASDSFHTYNIY